jgi:ABC-type amino acid transport substrate-binding protein
MTRRRTLALLLAALALPIHRPAAAQERFVVALPRLPPQTFQSGEGRDASSLRVLLECAGVRDARFRIFTFPRHWAGFLVSDDIQAISTVPGESVVDRPGGRPIHLSEPYVHYQNGASTLAPLQVRSLAEVAGRRAVSFQGASSILPGLRDVRASFAAYLEIGDQQQHSALLFSRAADVVLADGLIFAEYNRRLAEEPKGALPFDPTQPVVFNPIFPRTPYRAAFRNAGLRDRVNACLHQDPVRDRLAAIHREYVSRYRDVVGDRY